MKKFSKVKINVIEFHKEFNTAFRTFICSKNNSIIDYISTSVIFIKVNIFIGILYSVHTWPSSPIPMRRTRKLVPPRSNARNRPTCSRNKGTIYHNFRLYNDLMCYFVIDTSFLLKHLIKHRNEIK